MACGQKGRKKTGEVRLLSGFMVAQKPGGDQAQSRQNKALRGCGERLWIMLTLVLSGVLSFWVKTLFESHPRTASVVIIGGERSIDRNGSHVFSATALPGSFAPGE